MIDYAELVRCIRDCWDERTGERVGDVTVCHCDECLFKGYAEEHDGWTDYTPCETRMALAAADAIEELKKAVYFHKYNSEFWEDKYNSLADEKWVPVTELPPEGETYGDTTFSVEVLGTEGFTYRKAYYNFHAEVWLDGNEEEEWPSITHWMPLPAPPEV